MTCRHFYGPITSPSEDNPWRHTPDPGPRLQDETLADIGHMMFQEGDGLAQWEECRATCARTRWYPQEGASSWYAADREHSSWGLSVMMSNYGPPPIINTIVY